MWRDNQPQGCSRPILFPHSAKRVRDCRQNHHDCRQNIPWLLWNDLLITPYVSEHYKYMFLVARDLYEMLVLSRRKHTSRRSTVGIWSTSISYASHEYTVGRRSALGQVSRQAAIEVLDTSNNQVPSIKSGPCGSADITPQHENWAHLIKFLREISSFLSNEITIF